MPCSWSVSLQWNNQSVAWASLGAPHSPIMFHPCFAESLGEMWFCKMLRHFLSAFVLLRAHLSMQTLGTQEPFLKKRIFLHKEKNKYSYHEMLIGKHLTELKSSKLQFHLETLLRTVAQETASQRALKMQGRRQQVYKFLTGKYMQPSMHLDKRLVLIIETPTSQVNDLSAFLCVGRCMNLRSL